MAFRNWADIWGDVWGAVWADAITGEISPAAGSITITGQTVTVLAAGVLAPSEGTVSIAGQAVTVLGQRSIAPALATIQMSRLPVTIDAVFESTGEGLGILIFPVVKGLINPLINGTNLL